MWILFILIQQLNKPAADKGPWGLLLNDWYGQADNHLSLQKYHHEDHQQDYIQALLFLSEIAAVQFCAEVVSMTFLLKYPWPSLHTRSAQRAFKRDNIAFTKQNMIPSYLHLLDDSSATAGIALSLLVFFVQKEKKLRK